MTLRRGDILLVGSVPFDSVEDVLTTCAEKFGDSLYAMPDGELGPRAAWINALPIESYMDHPDLEPVQVVTKERAMVSPSSHDPTEMRATFPTFRLKPGVSETTFVLPYARDAISSYEVFRKLKESGKIPPQMRFQVCFPTTHAGIRRYFPEAEDLDIVRRAYNNALKADIEAILEHVPASELLIQWDYCLELLDILHARDDVPGSKLDDGRFEAFTSREYLAPMTEIVPDRVAMGYHICYGTWGGWPIGEVQDLGVCVSVANALIENTPRRTDFIHLPAMRWADEAFFKPLSELRVDDTKVFLGVELGDGVDEMSRRIEAARKHLPEFGVSHYCGYGRDGKDRVLGLMEDLRKGAERA